MSAQKSSFPYARAIFILAQEQNILEAVRADLLALRQAAINSEEFADLISNPIFKKSKKLEVVKNLLSGKANPTTISFLNILIEKGRIQQLDDIVRAFEDLYSKATNKVMLKITTAAAISEETKNKIASKILGNVQSEIQCEVNPELIGGFIAEFDNKMLDKSIKSQIEKLKSKLNS